MTSLRFILVFGFPALPRLHEVDLQNAGSKLQRFYAGELNAKLLFQELLKAFNAVWRRNWHPHGP